MKLKSSQIIVSLICALLAIACNNSHPTIPNSGTKYLKVATDPTFIPFEIQRANGKLEGFDIDLMNEIANAGGFRAQFQSLPFDGIVSALQAKKIDAAISGMTITPKRLKTISFSRPYLKAGLAIAVREDNHDIRDLSSLQGKRIAVQIGTPGADFAKTIPNAKISTFNSGPEFFQDLVNGNVDAVFCDAFATLYALKINSLQKIKVVGNILTEEYYGIATPKDSPYLNLINKSLTTLFSNGTYTKIYHKWFNTVPPQLAEQLY